MSAHDWPEYLEVVKGIDGCDIGLSKEEYIFARNAINDRDELERKIILAEQQRDALQQRCEELVDALREIQRVYTPNGNLNKFIKEAIKQVQA